MPVDFRRLPVPDNSLPPSVFVAQKEINIEDTNIPIKERRRKDGRKHNEVRPIYADVGINSAARGSAYIELGKTKIICAVHGPREVTKKEEFSLKGQLLCEFKYVTFSRSLRQSHQMSNEEKENSRIVQLALEPAVMLDKFPKARMDIFITVLEDDGSALSAAITCSSMALVDAGIAMYDVVLGASLLIVEDCIFLDPLSNEESIKLKSSNGNNALVTVGFMPSLNQISASDQKGCIDLTTLEQCITSCIDTSQSIHRVVQKRLKSSVKKQLDIEENK